MAITVMQSNCSQPFTDVLFVFGMDIARVPDVRCNGHTGIGKRKGHCLCLPQFSPGAAMLAVSAISAKTRQLNKIKWKIALSPVFAPVFYHERKGFPVLICTSGIGFPLVPDNTLYGEGDQRIDHAVKKQAGCTVGPRCIG